MTKTGEDVLAALGTSDPYYAAVKSEDRKQEVASLALEHATLCLRIIANSQGIDCEKVTIHAGHVRGVLTAIRKGIESTGMLDLPNGEGAKAKEGMSEVLGKLRTLFPELESQA